MLPAWRIWDTPHRFDVRPPLCRFGRAVETILNAIECAVEECAPNLTTMHFAEAWGMQEGCDWERNVFVSPNWASIELDAGAAAFEAARTARQNLQAGRK